MATARPRLLVFPTSSPLEWPILPLLEEWADVAVVGGAWIEDGGAARDAIAALDARGWDKVTVVSDEWSIVKTHELADARPDVFERVAIGHACLDLSIAGDNPTLNTEVFAGYSRLLQTNYGTFARALTQTTRGDYDDALVERFMQETSHEDFLAMFERMRTRALQGESFEPALRKLDVPMLLARHTDCLLWTQESFEAAAAAFPEATKLETLHKCSTSPEFADALRAFCAATASSRAAS